MCECIAVTILLKLFAPFKCPKISVLSSHEKRHLSIAHALRKTKRAGANPPTAPALSALLISERDSRIWRTSSGDLCHKHYTDCSKKSKIFRRIFRTSGAHFSTASCSCCHNFVHDFTKSCSFKLCKPSRCRSVWRRHTFAQLCRAFC